MNSANYSAANTGSVPVTKQTSSQSSPTYASALQRAQAINRRVAAADAMGQQERAKELQRRTAMRNMLNEGLYEVAGEMTP